MKIKAFYKRYRSEEPFRNKINLYNGAATSFVLTCIQLYGGIKYKSVWFTSFAIYYGVLTIVKFYLARSVGKTGREETGKEGRHYFKASAQKIIV